MKLYSIVALIVLVAFSSCRHKKEVVQITTDIKPVAAQNRNVVSLGKDTVNEPATDTAKGDVYRFIISWYSIGSGTDRDAYYKYVNYMTSYQKEKNVTLAIETVPWGREGEVDYCMKLNELNEVEQRDFIANLKNALDDAKWVHYYENKPCIHKH